MSTLNTTAANENIKPEDFASRALELLEQAYAYYSEPVRKKEGMSETYFEYVKAA